MGWKNITRHTTKLDINIKKEIQEVLTKDQLRPLMKESTEKLIIKIF